MFKRILVPIDGSETSRRALFTALKVAADSGGKGRLMHDLDELALLSGSEGMRMLELARSQGGKLLADSAAIATKAGVACDTRLVEAPGERLGEVVAEEAREWDADLIVAGTSGRRGLSRMVLGSGAEQIIRLAPVPVLTVRDAEAA